MSQYEEKRDSIDVKKDISTLEYAAQDDPYGFGSKSEEWHAEYNKKLLRKIDFRMLPLLSYICDHYQGSDVSSAPVYTRFG